MAKTIKLRCSSLDRIMQCPASAKEPELHVIGDMSAARLGTAAHSLLEHCVRHDLSPLDPVIDAMAVEMSVDADELSMLVWNGWNCWQQLRPHFPSPVLEQEWKAEYTPESGPIVELSGHPDVASLASDGKQLRIIDWKSGRIDDKEYTQQMKGYAFLGSSKYPEVESVYVVVVDLRTMQTRMAEAYTADSLLSWFLRMVEHVSSEAVIYNPGEHCGFCPRSAECVARQTLLSDCFHLVTSGSDYLPPGDPHGERAAQIGKMHQATKLMRRMLDEADSHIRAEVEAAGGVLPTSDGMELALQEVRREKINGGAIDTLRGCYGNDVNGAVTVSKTKLLDVVRGQAERGEKKAAADWCMERLRDLGHVEESAHFELKLRKTVPELEK